MTMDPTQPTNKSRPMLEPSPELLNHPAVICLDGIFEFFARLEFYNVAGFDFDGVTGLGIAAFASLTTDF